MRLPRAEDGWLFFGYLAWFCLIYAIWRLIEHAR